MTTYPTIPAEHLRIGHCIGWEGRGAEIEDTTHEPDEGQIYVRIRFDGALWDEGYSIPYGTPIELLHKSQFDQWRAVQDAAAAKLDATMEALRQPVGRAA
jgi:hypothetical protein